MTIQEEQIATGLVANTPSPKSLDDLQEILQMYNEVTQRLQVSHERLQQEVARLTEQLEQKNRELERRKRLAELGEMAAGIAHEIRNPLGGIQLYASSLMNDVADRPQAVELVQKISKGVKGLNLMVSDMLAFTRDVNLQREQIGITEVVNQAVELAGPTLAQNGVEVRIGGQIETMTGSVDGKLLGRVLLNLVMNAAEAIGEETRNASLETRNGGGVIEICGESRGGRMHLVIEDNGPGIPADVVERVFNPFFTTKHSGTGLGLAIVHRIVEAHGGSITAENRPAPEHGARFRIVL